jgi:hypothetical protein
VTQTHHVRNGRPSASSCASLRADEVLRNQSGILFSGDAIYDGLYSTCFLTAAATITLLELFSRRFRRASRAYPLKARLIGPIVKRRAIRSEKILGWNFDRAIVTLYVVRTFRTSWRWI